jgi:hypothetical protein
MNGVSQAFFLGQSIDQIFKRISFQRAGSSANSPSAGLSASVANEVS